MSTSTSTSTSTEIGSRAARSPNQQHRHPTASPADMFVPTPDYDRNPQRQPHVPRLPGRTRRTVPLGLLVVVELTGGQTPACGPATEAGPHAGTANGPEGQ